MDHIKLMVSRFLNKNRHLYFPEDAEKINKRLDRAYTAGHVRIKKMHYWVSS